MCEGLQEQFHSVITHLLICKDGLWAMSVAWSMRSKPGKLLNITLGSQLTIIHPKFRKKTLLPGFLSKVTEPEYWPREEKYLQRHTWGASVKSISEGKRSLPRQIRERVSNSASILGDPICSFLSQSWIELSQKKHQKVTVCSFPPPVLNFPHS